MTIALLEQSDDWHKPITNASPEAKLGRKKMAKCTVNGEGFSDYAETPEVFTLRDVACGQLARVMDDSDCIVLGQYTDGAYRPRWIIVASPDAGKIGTFYAKEAADTPAELLESDEEVTLIQD